MAILVQNDGLKTALWRQWRACLPSNRKCCYVDVTLINKQQVKCWFCLKAYFFDTKTTKCTSRSFFSDSNNTFLLKKPHATASTRSLFLNITCLHNIHSLANLYVWLIPVQHIYCSGVSFSYFGLLVTIVIARMPQSMSLYVNCAISKSFVCSWSFSILYVYKLL